MQVTIEQYRTQLQKNLRTSSKMLDGARVAVAKGFPKYRGYTFQQLAELHVRDVLVSYESDAEIQVRADRLAAMLTPR